MKKKIVALLCTVAMTCTLLAGCGQSAADTAAGTSETEDSTEVETDAQCTAAKEAWDALTDAQKELVPC